MPGSEGQPVDLAVIGGGIAGLWILDAAVRAGRNAILVEAFELGHGQSVAAQGIIHGGLKYTLRERDLDAAGAIADMPGFWRDRHESNDGPGPDLRDARMSTPCTWMWRTDSLASRLGMLGAKAALRTRPETVPESDRPALLRTASGAVLRVAEPVFDTRSVLSAIADAHSGRIVGVDGPEGIEFASAGGCVERMILRSGDAEVAVRPASVVLAAGVGNEGLLARLGLDAEVAQRRPLHMALVRSRSLPEFHGHCVDGNKTRVTITSARDDAGRTVWQLGGDLAERGVDRDDAAQRRAACDEVRGVLPGLDLDRIEDLEWSSYRVDRAERRTRAGLRPDDAEVMSLHAGRLTTAWPTTWAPAPRLAAAVLEATEGTVESTPETLTPQHPPAEFETLRRPRVAAFPWEERSWTSHHDVVSAEPA
ncbi:MAG: FAD-dependent oxidoreductase [Phycisphaeraceae bacterium]|nr:FAD-dependent oxidoreductase [Phycisphaeraceae bacterium]